MSASAYPVDRPALRVTRSTVTLLMFAALAWAGSVAYARHMGNGPGSMGVGFAAFLAMWVSMMTAMMLPAVAPVASEYAGSVTSNRAARLAGFVGGYLLVWMAVGIPMYAALRVVDHVVGNHDTTMRNISVGVLVVAGLYQLGPFKSRCLAHCRSPLPQLSRDPQPAGPRHELRIGLHYGVACVACSWALMALFIAFGLMDLWATIAVAAVVVGERLLPRGLVVTNWAGAACLLLALLVSASPRTANTLVPSPTSMSNMTKTGM